MDGDRFHFSHGRVGQPSHVGGIYEAHQTFDESGFGGTVS